MSPEEWLREASQPLAKPSRTDDPPAKAHGGIFRHGATLPTAICLSKATFGAGVLTMAAHCAEVGLSWQVGGLVIGGLLAMLSLWMIAETCVALGRWSYEDISEELMGPMMSIITGASIYGLCLGGGVGYLIATGQVFKVLFGASDFAQQVFVVFVGLAVCMPLSVLRQVGVMRHLAAVSILALLLLVVVVVYHLVSNGRDETVTQDTLWFGRGEADLFAHMNALNNVIFAYANQVNAPQLIGEMSPKPSVRKTVNVALITIALCFAFYASVSHFGVLAFGVGTGQHDSLILDLTPDQHSPVVVMAFAASMFSTIICLQLHVYPMRQFAAYLVRKVRGRSVEDEVHDTVWRGHTVARWLDVVSAVVAVLAMIVIAVGVRSLVAVLDFLGAFGGAYTSYVVPAVWMIQLSRRRPDFSWLAPRVLVSLALLLLGVFFVVFGTYSAIRGALAPGGRT